MRTLRFGVSGILILALSQGACSEDLREAPQASRTDSAGVALTTNKGPDRTLDWTVELLLELGSVEEGPTAFFRVSDTSIGSDARGTLYVLDAGRHLISVFDRSGAHLRSFGRRGRGPGELGFPAYMAVDAAGRTAVYDFDRRALVMYDAAGSYTGVLPLPIPLDGKIALLDDGRIVAAVARPTRPADSVDVRLLMLGSDTTELASVRRTDRFEPQPFACPVPALPSLFLPRVIWGAGGRQRIALSDDVTYSVRVYDGDRLVAIWRRELPIIPATRELAAWEVAGGDSLRVFSCVVPPEEAAVKLGFSATAPIIKRIAVSPDGAVWLLRRTATAGDHRIDVLDAEGMYLGTLPPRFPFPALFRGPNEIVTVEPSDLDVPRIRVYRVDQESWR